MVRYYSREVPKILNRKERERIGRQIIGDLGSRLSGTEELSCLDIGCSSGVITNLLAGRFGKVVGVDVDEDALAAARKNFRKKNTTFLGMDASDLKFKNGTFDVVIANQVYEFVDDDRKVFKEIRRVLKPGGICFFGARNKYAIMEAQYNLPFLAWLPKWLSDLIVRAGGKGSEFVGRYRSYWGLRQLVKGFRVHDYTTKLLRDPKKFNFTKPEKYKIFMRTIPLSAIYPFIPNYIWILEKPY